MIETVDDFMKTQSLIIYQPGHMGSFLINMLHQNNYKKECEFGNLGKMYNREWYTTDYSNIIGTGYYNVDIVNDPKYQIISKFKDYIGYTGSIESEQELLFLFAKFVYLRRLSLDELLIRRIENHFETFAREPLMDPMYTSIKYHPNINDNNFVYNLAWKNMIYCYFPDDKLWIKYIIHFEKMMNYFYFLHMKKIHQNRIQSRIAKFVTGILQSDYKLFKMSMDPRIEGLPKNVQYINMYDLVFKQDLSEISRIFPDIDFSKKQYLIDEAYKDCINILNFYGLDHDLNLTHSYHEYDFFYCKEMKSFKDFIFKHYSIEDQTQNNFIFEVPAISKQFISGVTSD